MKRPAPFLLAQAAVALLLATPAWAEPDGPGMRQVVVDLAEAHAPLDRFFDLSVGWDYPGTLIRPDTLSDLTRDQPETDTNVQAGLDGRLSVTLPMRANDVALLTLSPVKPSSPHPEL